MILATHELLGRHHHDVVLRLLLLLLLLLLLHHRLLHHGLHHGLLNNYGLLRGHAIPHVRLLVPTQMLLNLPARTNINAGYTYRWWCEDALCVLGIASHVHVGRGVVLMPHALHSVFVAVVAGGRVVRPTILWGFVAPDVVGDVLAVELADVGVGVGVDVVAIVSAPRWLVAPAVSVVVVIVIVATAPAAPVAIVVVVLVLLGGLLLLLLMPRLLRVHCQLLSHLLHSLRLLLYLILLVANCLLPA